MLRCIGKEVEWCSNANDRLGRISKEDTATQSASSTISHSLNQYHVIMAQL